MASNQNLASFSQLALLSTILLLVSGLLTYWVDHNWSLFGNLGWLSIPLGVFIAAMIFIGPVLLISHRWLRLHAFYQLTALLHDLTRQLTWPQIVILSVLAGLGEELLFRGVIQSWLTEFIGVYSAIVISSVIFATLHALTLYYFVFTFLLSLLLAFLFHTTQSMAFLVVIHAVYDVIALGVIAKYSHLLGLDVDQGRKIKL